MDISAGELALEREEREALERSPAAALIAELAEARREARDLRLTATSLSDLLERQRRACDAELADARQEIRSLRAALDGARIEADSSRDERYIRDRALEVALGQLDAVRAESARHALIAAARLKALTEAATQRDAAAAEIATLRRVIGAVRRALP